MLIREVIVEAKKLNGSPEYNYASDPLLWMMLLDAAGGLGQNDPEVVLQVVYKRDEVAGVEEPIGPYIAKWKAKHLVRAIRESVKTRTRTPWREWSKKVKCKMKSAN